MTPSAKPAKQDSNTLTNADLPGTARTGTLTPPSIPTMLAKWLPQPPAFDEAERACGEVILKLGTQLSKLQRRELCKMAVLTAL